MSIWRWAELTGCPGQMKPITLGEGETPLVRSRSIGPASGLQKLYFKLETSNPSGSYKDRFASAAITNMIAQGQTTCIATSSGNTGAALAAYCAAAKIRCRIAVVETAPVAKLQQMLACGAEIIRVKGFGTDAAVTDAVFSELKKLAGLPGSALQISAYACSPIGMRGVESISFELAEQVEGGVHHIFCPAGGGGLTLAVARGFSGLKEHGRSTQGPAVHCVQPEGNDTIAGALRAGRTSGRDVECTSMISGLQVASVIDGNDVIRECRPTGGTGHLVADEDVWDLQKQLAREEGIFCEPAGAVALAGALKARSNSEVAPGDTVVCLVTGSGFKDAGSVERMNSDRSVQLIAASELASSWA